MGQPDVVAQVAVSKRKAETVRIAEEPTAAGQPKDVTGPSVGVRDERRKDVTERSAAETDGWHPLGVHLLLPHRHLVEPRRVVLESTRIQPQPRLVGCFCSIS